MKVSKSLPFIIFGAVLVVGFALGSIYDVPHIELTDQIDPLALVSIMATLLIAAYVGRIISKTVEEGRVEKQMMMNRLDDALSIAEDVQAQLDGGQFEYKEAAASIKRMNKAVTCICNLAEKAEYTVNEQSKGAVQKSIRDLNELLTNTPRIDEEVVNGAELPIEVIDGLLKYSKSQKLLIELAFDRVKDNVLMLQISINRL